MNRLLIAALLVLPLPLRAQDVDELVGAYRTAPHEYVAISVVQAGDNRLLLLADTRDEALRVLFPVAADTFIAGETIADPSTPERRVVFVRRGGAVIALHMEGIAGGTVRAGERVSLGLLPIRIDRPDATLHGTLLMPSGHGPRPLIALAHGSENNDRHSFGPIPWVLAAEGFAVVIYDKRGTGESTGSWQDAGIEELASDLAAVIESVAARADVDSARIAIVGVSEGGWVAPRAARETTLVRAILAISGGGMTKGDAYVHKNRRIALEAGLIGAALDSAIAEARLTITESADRVARDADPSGFDRRVTYDPARDWAAFHGPVLYLGGEYDVLESAPEAAAWLQHVFDDADNASAAVRVFPRAHHSLLLGIEGTPSEFRTLAGMRQLVPGYWATILGWLRANL